MFYLNALFISLGTVILAGLLFKKNFPPKVFDLLEIVLFILIMSLLCELLMPKGFIGCKLPGDECEAAFRQLQHFSWRRFGFFLIFNSALYLPVPFLAKKIEKKRG